MSQTQADNAIDEKRISIFELPVQNNRCPDYDEDCYKVPDPFCCFFDCLNIFGGQAEGYCPLIHPES